MSLSSLLSSASVESSEAEPWERDGGFLLYLAVMFYIFYAFEIICDEFLVPALNLFCERLGMSDDFAGATLMGLGGCAPDIFSGIFGLLVMHTDVGAGTIVGSLLFNHLFILGGVCLAVRPFKLHLASFVRETLFYAASLALLLGSLWDHRITVWESTALMLTYVLYCVVCGFTPRITKLLQRVHAKVRSSRARGRASEKAPLLVNDDVAVTVVEEEAPAVPQAPTTAATAPAAAAAAGEEESKPAAAAPGEQPTPQTPAPQDPRSTSMAVFPTSPTLTSTSAAESAEAPTAEVSKAPKTPEQKQEEAKRNVARLKHASMRAFSTIHEEDAAKGVPETTGAALGLHYGNVQMHGFLEKKSDFYTKARVASQQWQRRWFVLGEGFWYCRNPLYPSKNCRQLSLWATYGVERTDPSDRRVFSLLIRGDKSITLRADTPDHADEWIAALSRHIDLQREACPDLITPAGVVGIGTEAVDDEIESLWMPPQTLPKRILWALGLPMLFLFTITIPNVKIRRWRNWYVLTFLFTFVWLAALSYAMLFCADRFALALHIPDDIMGLTITAIGASLPTFFGSVISARQGTTGMAVSNTFGANLSSILVAIGLPCFIHTAIIRPGHAQPIESQGIRTTVLVLAAALVIFLISLAITRMRFNRILGFFYLGLYAALLGVVVLLEQLHVTW